MSPQNIRLILHIVIILSEQILHFLDIRAEILQSSFHHKCSIEMSLDPRKLVNLREVLHTMLRLGA